MIQKEVIQMATMTVNELSEVLEATPREVRKFLRSVTPRDEQPGKGSRWSIEKKSVRSLKSQYAKYVAALEAKKATDDEVEAPEAETE